MPTYIALLYSITLPQNRRLIMADLRDLATSLELQNPRTVLATGNLIFETAKPTTAVKLTTQLEAAYRETFGRQVDIIIITADHLKKVIASNPFPEESKTDPSHVIIRVMRNPITAETLATLQAYTANGEQIRAAVGHLWIHFAKDIGHSKLAAVITPKRAGGPGTSRNWNTLQKIQQAL